MARNNFDITDSGIASKTTTPKAVQIQEQKTIAKQVEDYKKELEQQRIKNQVEYEVTLRANGYNQLTKLQQENAEAMYDYLNKYQLEGVKNVEKFREQLVQDFERKSKLSDSSSNIKAREQREQDLKETRKEATRVLYDKDSSDEEKEEAKKVLKEVNSELGIKFEGSLKENALSIDNVMARTSKAINKLASSIDSGINNIITKYANYQSAIDVRLQGLGTNFESIDKNLTKSVGVSALFKTETLMNNVQSLAEQGIVYNIEQRAFLETISDKIAATFETTNATLLRLVKIQGEDSTASRLGMEAYLTRYFNEMWQDTQYLQNTYDSVSAALLEATATMTSDEAIQFEYQVQKWLGSLSSIGMSDTTITSLASALGALGSGDIETLQSNEGMQNLIVMAASNAGLDYASMLTNGLDAASTNTLMQSIVDYLHTISETSKDNKVVMSQYAEVFGMDVSDLVAATNLQTEQLQSLSTSFMDTQGAISELSYQMSQITNRMSLSEKLENLYSNAIYSLGSNIAESPAMYATWKITSLIQDYTGGINIPTISVFGSSVDLNTTVENLIKTGIVGISSLGLIGDIISGVNNAVDPSSMLSKLGVNTGGNQITYGKGLSSRSAVQTLSSKYIVGNSAGGDIASSAQTSAENAANEKADAQKEESDDKTINDLYDLSSTLSDLETAQLTTLNDTASAILTRMSSMYYSSTGVEGLQVGINDSSLSLASQSGKDTLVAEPTEETSNISSIATNVNTIVSILQSVLSGDSLRVELSSSSGSFGSKNI